MKFMIIARFKDSIYTLPPEKVKELTEAQAKFHKKLAKEGKLKESYYLGNMKGMVAIYDLDSPEDLARFTESPGFALVDAEITPLVDMDVVRKVQAKK